MGNGTDHPVNTSVVRYISWPNGTDAVYINGTLPNGTTAAGGTEPSDPSQVSGAVQLMANYVGYWVMVAVVVGTVLLA